MENTSEAKKHSTIADDSPVFKSWNNWYLLVILCNLVVVTTIFFYFKSI